MVLGQSNVQTPEIPLLFCFPLSAMVETWLDSVPKETCVGSLAFRNGKAGTRLVGLLRECPPDEINAIL